MKAFPTLLLLLLKNHILPLFIISSRHLSSNGWSTSFCRRRFSCLGRLCFSTNLPNSIWQCFPQDFPLHRVAAPGAGSRRTGRAHPGKFLRWAGPWLWWLKFKGSGWALPSSTGGRAGRRLAAWTYTLPQQHDPVHLHCRVPVPSCGLYRRHRLSSGCCLADMPVAL
jgi:hypothetical protein